MSDLYVANYMKTPSIPLSIVYKVVQVAPDGSMWSCNSLPRSVAEVKLWKKCIRYRLRHQVLPNSGTKALFVCPTLSDAKEALNWFCSSNFKKYYILRGYGAEVIDVGRGRINRELFLTNLDAGYDIYPMWDFKTALCSWFIPIGIVGRKVMGQHEAE